MELSRSTKRSRDTALPPPAPRSSALAGIAAGSAAPAPFRGPAADSALGERFLDVIPLVSAVGYAAEVSQCLYLCGLTFRAGDKGATNDMLVRSQERQCGARAARAAAREDLEVAPYGVARGSTQLARAAIADDLPRALQLVQLGAPLGLVGRNGLTALHWACRLGREAVARALLDGKYEGRGAAVDRLSGEWTPLMLASREGHLGVVRLLLERGAAPAGSDFFGFTSMHWAVKGGPAGRAEALALLCAAPGAGAALAARDSDGRTPMGLAAAAGRAECEAVLRKHGAPL